MTNVPTVSFGATGFQAPSTTQVLTGVIADIQAAFSGKLNLSITNLASLGTSQGQLATSMTGSIVNANNAFLVQASQTDPAYASGRWQDAIGNLYSMQRNPSEPTALQIACNGAQGVNIPVGASLIDGSGNIYLATQAGVIPVGGSITLTFANLIPGPVAVPATVAPYQTIPGWDSATVISGAIGRNVESRAAFEQRRQDSVAGNSFGPIGAIIGAVAKVTGVLDYYGYNNNTANPVTINGVSIASQFDLCLCRRWSASRGSPGHPVEKGRRRAHDREHHGHGLRQQPALCVTAALHDHLRDTGGAAAAVQGCHRQRPAGALQRRATGAKRAARGDRRSDR